MLYLLQINETIFFFSYSWWIGVSRHRARSTGLCGQVLHWRGQLGPDWQQHPHFLHQGCSLGVCVRSKNPTLCSIINQIPCKTCHHCFLYTVQFPSFIHTQKRNPQTHMKDPDMVWDFWSLRPESLHQVSVAGFLPAAQTIQVLIVGLKKKKKEQTCWFE